MSYTELAWIKNDSAAMYVNTGYKPNQDTRVHMKVSEPGKNAYFFNSWSNDWNKNNYSFVNDYAYSSGRIFVSYGDQTGGSEESGEGRPVITGTNEIDYNKNTLTVNGTVFHSFKYTAFQSLYNMYLFAQNRKDTTSYYSSDFSFKLHWCKIYENDVLVRDFIPVLDENGAACLFDKVSSAYFYDGNGKAFMAGPKKVQGVTPLAYLESTGTQYIDTGLFANPKTKIEVSFMVTQYTTNWDTIFGTRNGPNSGFTARFANAIDGKLGLQYSNGGTAKTAYYDSPHPKSKFGDTFHTIKFEKNFTYIDGVLEYSFNSPIDSVQYPYSLYLFANNDAGSPGDYAYIRISYCKIWDEDGELVRDFAAVMDDDGIACFLDKATKTYFYNKGTGDFKAGPPVADDSTESLHYIESDGTQCINLDYVHTTETKIELDCMVFSNTQRNFEALFGSRYRSYQSNAFVFFTRFGGEDVPVYNRSGYETKGSNFPYNKRVKLTCYQKTSTWITEDGAEGSITAQGTANAGVAPMFLFDLNNAQSNGDLNQDNSRSVMRVYSLKIYEGSTLVRHYIPAKDSKGVIFLYEEIDGLAYYSLVGNPFIADYVSFGSVIFSFDAMKQISSVSGSAIQWTADTPEGTTLKVSARIVDGVFVECINGDAIPCISNGDDLSSKVLDVKVDMSTEDTAVTPSLMNLSISIGDSGDDRIIVLVFPEGNVDSLQNAVGDISISYGGGTLRGVGGAVEPFDMSFAPVGLVPKNNPNDAEHISMSDIEAVAEMIEVYYTGRYCDDKIDITSIIATGSLTSIDDI